MNIFEFINAISGIATAAGVGIAPFQFFQSQQQAKTAFADTLTARHQSIASELPLGAVLGLHLSAPELDKTLKAFHEYFELCNEQAFLSGELPKTKRRIPRDTWREWKDGIEQNMTRPAFKDSWVIRTMDANDSNFSNLSHLLPRSFPSKKQIEGTPHEVLELLADVSQNS